MKTIKLVGIFLIISSISVFAQKSEINLKESVVKWTGNKIGGSHNGDIKIKGGSIELKAGNIVKGNIVIDMKTISNADLKNEVYNKKLVDHLISDDFFGVEKHPTASFVLSKASKFKNGKATLEGMMSIKGKAEKISFDVMKKNKEYTAQIKLDRSKFDIRYGSNSFFDNLGDKAIDDIFILDIKLLVN